LDFVKYSVQEEYGEKRFAVELHVSRCIHMFCTVGHFL